MSLVLIFVAKSQFGLFIFFFHLNLVPVLGDLISM